MDRRLIFALNEARGARRPAILITDIASGDAHIVNEAECADPSLREAIAAALLSGKSGLVEAADKTYFLNVHVPPARLVVIGAVHISQTLAPMARLAGFDVTIIDPRTAFATAERFEGTRLVADWPEDALRTQPLDMFTAVAAVTHDPKIDDHALQAALTANCFYVGALGSRKTHARRIDRLREAGVGDAAIDRIAAPIGLDIGAASPAEIAVAVLAEIIAALRKRTLTQNLGEMAA
ncbi:XdhC family protein [Pararhizobium haloflavum]|uniref:XdhC family protein n=1 Tax=Pararhizobium haloflavum TaxID=2037914 RepID=UPI000C17D003|nr:XdhC family protein [Pararhizobium haloflavum]